MNGNAEDSSNHRWEQGNMLVTGSALFLVLAAYFWRLYFLRVRFFDADEFEHLHAAWCVSKGLVLYRDFFENHTPWIYFFFAPFFRFYNADTNFADAHAFFIFARTWMWIFTGLILTLTFWLGHLWRGTQAGFVSALFLGNTVMFLEKTIEVRPDVPGVVFWLACLIAVIRSIRGEESARKSRWQFAWSGIFLGAAFLFTQKMFFAFPGLAFAMLWYLLDPRSRGTRRQRFWNVICQVLGFSLPVILTLGYFAARGSLGAFFECNFLVNIHWKYHFSPTIFLKQLVKDNTILVGLALFGFFSALWSMFARERFRRGEFVYVLSALGLFGGLFIIQEAFRQYYLTFLPLGAVFASSAFMQAVGWAAAMVSGERAQGARAALYTVAGFCAFVGLVILGFRVSKPHFLDNLPDTHGWLLRPFLTEMWSLTLVSAAVCLLFRWKSIATVVLLAALSLYPFKIMLVSSYHSHDTNTTMLNEIRYVQQNTSPTETCMDGSRRLGVFRPHAWYYWNLAGDVRAMISESAKNELGANLRSGSIAPKLIFYDGDLKGLSAETAEFFESHYEPTGVGPIQRRKE